MTIQAFYQTRRGAHVVERITTEARALHLLSKHRGWVRIEADGEVIGTRQANNYAHLDDKRIKWIWSLDPDAFKFDLRSPPCQ